MEASKPPNTVEPFQPATYSRPGPVIGVGKEVFQNLSAGKYFAFPNRAFPDKFSDSSVTNLPDQTAPTIDIAANFSAAANLPENIDQTSLGLHSHYLHHHASKGAISLHCSLGRTPASSLMEASEPPNTVEPFQPATCSRPGPVVGVGKEVFQNPRIGKYSEPPNCAYSDEFPDCSATHQAGSLLTPDCLARQTSSSTVDHLDIVLENQDARTSPVTSSMSASYVQDLSNNFSSLPPGRTLAISLEEAPSPLNTVELFQPAASSRPGPVIELGEGVFRTLSAGKYNRSKNASLPNSSSTSSLGQRRDDLLLYYQNVGGINSSVQDYRLAISDRCFDVIVLIETWLNDDTVSSLVFGTVYEVFRCDRNPSNSRKSSGGGVLVAVNSNLKARAVENRRWDCLEQMWTIIDLGDRKLFLCAFYIPPNRIRDQEYIEAHCNSVYSILEEASENDTIMVLGDFNLPNISWKTSLNGFLYPDANHSVFHAGAMQILDCYSSATLLQVNPVANESGRHLDLCFVSDQDSTTSVTMAPAPLVKMVVHHPPLLITVGHSRVHDLIITPASVSYDFPKANHRGIAELLSSFDWNSILDPQDVDSAAQTFSNILTYVIDRHVPKRIRDRQPGPPWQTNALRRLKSVKRAALRRFTKYRTLPLRNYYVRLNHNYKRASQACFAIYQQNIQRKLKSHPKGFWKYVREQRKESGLPSTLTLNGITASSPQEICTLFSEKFANVFSHEVLTDDQIRRAVDSVPNSGQTLAAIDVDETMIIRASSQLKSAYNPGPDGFPSVLLKKHISDLMTPLLLIFRASLINGVFPSCWKSAHIFPIYKNGSKRDVNNYRGISSLNAISKLFELVVMEPLQEHCKQFLSEDQHGFTPGRSTTSNLLCLTSYITDSMESRAQTDVIYTDLSAAFDKVNHDIAVAKMDKFGIHGGLLRWFRSYLTGRELRVVIGASQGFSFVSSSGIPQGSHLGPLIFLLYFNDVHLVLRVPKLSYADDLKMYLRINSIEDCGFLQQQLLAFADWCSLNRMSVNPKKCSVITFSRKRNPIFFEYRLAEGEIERVDHVKDLGVILDPKLTFKQHVSYVVDKASRTLGCIFRLAKSFTDIYCLKALYCSLSRSILEYCTEVWSPNYNNGVERIESVQRRFLRYALRKLPWRNRFRLPSYEDRCRLIHLEPLYARRNTARAMLIVDSLQGRLNCPAILQQINLYVAPRALRNNVMLRLPFRRTNYSMHGAITGLQRVFNRVASLFDFNVSRQLLRRRFSSFFLSSRSR